MYTKQNLIADIEQYQPFDETEAPHKAAILELLNGTDNYLLRSDFPGHVTGSSWLISPDGQQALLTHHKILDRWLQFGGHADGEIDIRNVSLREAQEESGIEDISFVMPEIFDIDVHAIPANPKRNEPAHFHYDVRYLLRANSNQQTTSDESNELKWFSYDELAAMNFEPAIQRLISKWQSYLANK